MGEYKKIENKQFISSLFRILARQKVISVLVHYGNRQISAWMFFDDLAGNKLNIRFERSVKFLNGDKVKVTFSYKDVFFFIETNIVYVIENTYYLQRPEMIFSPCGRMIARCKVDDNEEALIYLPGRTTGLRLFDISAKGVSFISSDKCLDAGQTVKCAIIRLDSGIEVIVDISIRYCKASEDGSFLYGASFFDNDWITYSKLFSYIFKKEYPNLRPMEDFSTDEIYKLYDESGYLKLKSKSEMDRNFMSMARALDKIRNKPQIANNVVYYKDGKILSGASLLRIYDSTFLGHQLAAVPEARFVLKTKTDLYLGFAEFIMNHPYGKYHLAYFDATSHWQNEMYRKISEYINDNSKFFIDTIEYFECFTDKFECCNLPGEYKAAILHNPTEFARYCQTNLEPLAISCYAYSSEHFSLMEIRQAYEMLDLFVVRKLWRITRGDNLIGYAVAELYSDGLNLFNLLDMCRIYPVAEEIDFKAVLQDLMPEVITLYKKYKKKRFNVLFKCGKDVVEEIKAMPGMGYIFLTGRAFVNQDGMSEHKKLLAVSTR